MKILYHAQGKNRKELADAISTITEAAKMYKGIPSYAYEIGCFTVDRDGNLNFDDMVDKKKIENLLEKLDSMGFHADPTGKEPDDSASEQKDTDGLVIAMPRSFFTDTALENLKKLIQAKSNLMLKVFQTDVLRMKVTEDKVLFPGLPAARMPIRSKPIHISLRRSAIWRKSRNEYWQLNEYRPTRNTISAVFCSGLALSARNTGRTEAAPAAPFRLLGL